MNALTSKNFANVFGVVYLVIGVVGFFLTGFSDFVASDGATLILFEVNPLHNVVHLLIGGALVAAAQQGEAAARPVVLTVAVVYAIVGVVGFFIVGTGANILALNIWDHFLHLGTAVIAFVAAGGTRVTAPA